MPYAARVETGGEGGASIADIIADQPSETVDPAKESVRRKDLRPVLILGLVVAYSFTITMASITVININGTSVAKACVETGGEWVIHDGTRECRRD